MRPRVKCSFIGDLRNRYVTTCVKSLNRLTILRFPIQITPHSNVSFSFSDDGVNIESMPCEAYADDLKNYSEDKLHTQ